MYTYIYSLSLKAYSIDDENARDIENNQKQNKKTRK